jgi:hypothetical protein
MAARLSRAALRLLSELATRVCRQLVRLHGMGNWCPTRRSERVGALVQHHIAWTTPWSEAETAHANEKVVVRGGDLSCETEIGRRSFLLAGNLSEKLPTGRKQDVLQVMVLTGVLSPPHLESWPSRCQWCQKTPPQEWLSRHQRGS